jgi:hypothetical protein
MQICCKTLAIILGFVWKNASRQIFYTTFEKKLQESPKFHSEANLFHGYAHFNYVILFENQHDFFLFFL